MNFKQILKSLINKLHPIDILFIIDWKFLFLFSMSISYTFVLLLTFMYLFISVFLITFKFFLYLSHMSLFRLFFLLFFFLPIYRFKKKVYSANSKMRRFCIRKCKKKSLYCLFHIFFLIKVINKVAIIIPSAFDVFNIESQFFFN